MVAVFVLIFLSSPSAPVTRLWSPGSCCLCFASLNPGTGCCLY
uniref:Uncharacterized protein n=1 Tax=Anguilla anguilla TaxID=7936 RepID=A0A0E9RGA7_ANGAN